MIFDHAARDPSGVAVDDLRTRRTWAELADRATRVARFLRETAGVSPGEHVAILMENRVEYVELLIGGILAGTWVTPINWHLADDEIAYVVADSGARVLFTDAGYAEPGRRAMVAAGRSKDAVVEVGAALDAALDGASDVPMPLDGPAGGNMIYTSAWLRSERDSRWTVRSARSWPDG